MLSSRRCERYGGIYYAPQSRYSYTWEVNDVLDFFGHAVGNEQLSLPELTTKTAALVALATMARTAELASISLHSIRFSNAGATLQLSRPRKTQRVGPGRLFSLSTLPETEICPVAWLQAYIAATGGVRAESASTLFVATTCSDREPYNRPLD